MPLTASILTALLTVLNESTREGREAAPFLSSCEKHLQADLASHILVFYTDLQRHLHRHPPPALQIIMIQALHKKSTIA